MGKFLKVVVFILLLVSVGTAFLAYMNFEKRKMLVGRAEKLESFAKSVAMTLNKADPAKPDILPDFDARDVTSVEAREVARPDTSSFWEDYKVEFEDVGEIRKMDDITKETVSGPNGIQIPKIRQYYRLDGEGKRVPSYDGFETTGSGTMSELLDEVMNRATAQSRLVNDISAELKKIREELVDTIRELNEQKKLRRGDLVRIQNLEADKRRLEQEKSDLEAAKSRLESETLRLKDDKTRLQSDLEQKEEEVQDLQKKIADLDKRLKELSRGVMREDGVGSSGAADQIAVAGASGKSTPGVKGTVVYVDPNWPIVIVRLEPEAVAELTTTDADGNAYTRQEQYSVRRPGLDSPAGEFITRIRIQSLRRDGSNLAIADNLTTWQQTPVQKGDEVFFAN